MTARPCHEAFIYDGTDEFVRGIAAFARDAQRANEPIMIMVCGTKLAMLREELGADDVGVRFADIGSVGTNPARLIPMWLDFIAAARGRPSRGVGEPIWPERRGAELVEAQHHEALVNHALDPADPVWLVCPYDAGALDDTVVAEAARSHPVLSRHEVGVLETSAMYRGTEANVAAAFEAALPVLSDPVLQLSFDHTQLTTLRRRLADVAADAGVSSERVAEYALAACEIATNSIRHGGGRGDLHVWVLPADVVCEIRDRGRITEPLAGRERPVPGSDHGYGLWLANQFCDLVQVRSSAAGTTVRLHMRRH